MKEVQSFIDTNATNSYTALAIYFNSPVRATDASDLTYAAVVYSRMRLANGKFARTDSVVVLH